MCQYHLDLLDRTVNHEHQVLNQWIGSREKREVTVHARTKNKYSYGMLIWDIKNDCTKKTEKDEIVNTKR